MLVWKGSSSSAPGSPQEGWAYRNSGDGKTHIYLSDGSGSKAWRVFGQDGAAGAAGLPTLKDSSPTPQTIGYLLSSVTDSYDQVLTVLRRHDSKLWYFNLTWKGKVPLWGYYDIHLYYTDATSGPGSSDYGEETYIPYRIFGNPWNGFSSVVNTPTMYTFRTFTSAGLGGGTSISDTASGLKYLSGYLGTSSSGGTITSPTLYLLKNITWADIGLSSTITLPFKIELPQ
jgi:hypothetical protein